MASPHLSKTRYIAGLQCLRRLWLLMHEPWEHEAGAPPAHRSRSATRSAAMPTGCSPAACWWPKNRGSMRKLSHAPRR